MDMSQFGGSSGPVVDVTRIMDTMKNLDAMAVPEAIGGGGGCKRAIFGARSRYMTRWPRTTSRTVPAELRQHRFGKKAMKQDRHTRDIAELGRVGTDALTSS